MKITIAGMPGSGKSTLKEYLAKTFDYQAYSMGDLKGEFAAKKGMTIDEFMAKCSPEEVHHKVDNFQKELGETKDNFVIDGWMSWHFIKPSLRIFLETDWDYAAKRIFSDKRGADEPKYSSVKKCKKTIQQRYWETRKQTMQEYGGADFNDKNNFDIVVDTTNKTPEEVKDLVKRKITDYNNKMNPSTFYLGHPTESRNEIRIWEQGFEERTGIDLMNPFFDCNTLETKMGNLGKEKYLEMGGKVTALFRGDLEGISSNQVIGGIYIFDDSYTLGTPIEMAMTKLMGKLVYSVVSHREKDYQNHPSIRLFSDKIFTSLENLENYMNSNKTNFFRYLEKSRQQTLKDKTQQMIRKNIEYNKKFLAK